jgi:hypothetical protein
MRILDLPSTIFRVSGIAIAGVEGARTDAKISEKPINK